MQKGYFTSIGFTSCSYLICNTGSYWKKKSYADYWENQNIVRIQLSFIDFCKFKWRMNHQKFTSGSGIDDIIEATKRDIKAKEEIAKKQIETAKEINEQVKRNLQKEKGDIEWETFIKTSGYKKK